MARKDLIPFNKQSEEEVKRKASNGGKKSGEVRRRKKQLREELEILLEIADKNNKTIQEKICFALIKKASEGDTKAFEIIRDTIGQGVQQKVQVENVPIIKDDV